MNDVVTERNGHDIIRSVDYQSCYEATEVKLFKKNLLHIFHCVTVFENNMSKKYRTYFERY